MLTRWAALAVIVAVFAEEDMRGCCMELGQVAEEPLVDLKKPLESQLDLEPAEPREASIGPHAKSSAALARHLIVPGQQYHKAS